MRLATYILLIALIHVFPCFSQDYAVSGTITDEANAPIDYANILVLKVEDSSIVSGTSSNSKGSFVLNNIKPDKYILKVSYIGFDDFVKNIHVANDLNVPIIKLKESSQNLDEVEITVAKPTLRKEVDRLVFNVANTALSEGNMLEMIRSTPGVLVIDNSILVKNTVPTVYINNRKVHLSSNELTQLLESSPANSIKSIEVITNPSAKYDAESGTVLNIVMSKNLITGYRGSVFANYTQGVFPRYNAGINNFYKTKKLNIFANYSYTHSKINREGTEKINYLDNAVIDEHWDTKTNRNSKTKNHNFNLNLDYSFNDTNTLSLSANMLFLPDFEYITKGETDVFNADQDKLYDFIANNFSEDKKHNLGFDLDYVHDFKDASKLAVNAHYTTYDYNREQTVKSQYFYTDLPSVESAFNTMADQETSIYTSQIDYELPLGERSAFLVGIKSSFIKTESEINHFDIDGNNVTYNPILSDAFNYNEDILAAYLSYNKKWNKWSLSTGLRVEQTNIEGESPTTNQTNKQDYLKWFPTLNVSHSLGEKTSLYLNYKRSVERPNYQDLNPFRYFLNDNTIVTGNPNLQPAFVDHVVLGASFNDNHSIEAYYRYSDASFLELPSQDNDNNQFIYTPTNLDNSVEFGFDFSSYFEVTKKWSVYFVTSFYNVKDETKIDNDIVKKDTWSNYSVLSNDFSFLKDNSLSANFTIIYVGENQQGLQISSTRIVTDFLIKKTIFNKRATLSLGFSDLLNKQDFSVESKYKNQDNSRYFNLDNRYVKLGFNYKFGNTSLETNERTKERKERDRLEKN